MSANLTFKQAIIPLLLLFFGHFLIDFMIGIWPVYKTLNHLDLGAAGIITFLAVFLGEGLQLFFGPVGDLGYRKTILMFSFVFGIAPCLYACTENYFVLGMLLFFVCVASGAFHTAASGLLGSLTQDRKGLFITFFAAGGALGLSFSQLVYTKIFEAGSEKTLFLALPLFLILGLILAYLKDSNPAKTQDGKAKFFNLADLKLFFKNKRLRLLYILQVTNQTVVWAFIFLLPDLLRDRGYPEWLTFGGGHLIAILGGAIMMIPSGYLSDKKSPRAVLLSATCIGASLFYCFIFLKHLTLIALIPLIFLMGAFLNLVNPLSISYGLKSFPEKPGLVSAVLMGLVWIIAEGIGQGGGGLLTKLFSEDSAAKALSLIGFLFIPAIASAFLLPRAEPKTLQEPLVM
ncbi:MFS transporter [Criblamydia sequanensis]|uniref:Transporter, MFS family n=1 Tax=Candidatus Criblamydia sequanensis CRIB-18 TaxID=1437425 RepID=A0A090D2A3_9BACT|nr:MFS transporter [Criblamydia sequanensis]CDR34475.1 Transporter, MFS family [Criblamydia sequanensis CRIB-18]